MKKALLVLGVCAMVLSAGAPAKAGLTNLWIGGDRVVYDNTNDLYWYPYLTDTTGMVRAQQEGFITGMNGCGYAGIKSWEMADYDQLVGLRLHAK